MVYRHKRLPLLHEVDQKIPEQKEYPSFLIRCYKLLFAWMIVFQKSDNIIERRDAEMQS